MYVKKYLLRKNEREEGGRGKEKEKKGEVGGKRLRTEDPEKAIGMVNTCPYPNSNYRTATGRKSNCQCEGLGRVGRQRLHLPHIFVW